MPDNPVVSIITVVYNAEKHIQQAMDSVFNQTYKNIEYIIVDGASKDNTVNIIKNNESRIAKWVSEKDKGITDAFNKGIKMCTVEIVGLVNADDWLEPNAIELAVQNFENADIVYGDIRFWHREKPTVRVHSDHSRLRTGMTVAHPACYVKLWVYKKLGTFDTQYKVAMDYELLLRFFQNGIRFEKVDAIFASMRTEGNSDKRWKLGIEEELKIKGKYFSKTGNLYHFVRQYAIFTIKDVLRKFNYHR